EQKNAIISLKMGEIDIFKDKKEVTPILILDDLFSELDEEKIGNILTFINEDIQTFITTTELNKVGNLLKDNSKIFEVNNGIVTERND
ncbi:MAG: DNA replication and repair protein RecF, partial [Bacilli bacterium]|nr:DNA replication and repair protein RecF [Bacilli bacterium]